MSYRCANSAVAGHWFWTKLKKVQKSIHWDSDDMMGPKSKFQKDPNRLKQQSIAGLGKWFSTAK
jgi:hypothetical protein